MAYFLFDRKGRFSEIGDILVQAKTALQDLALVLADQLAEIEVVDFEVH